MGEDRAVIKRFGNVKASQIRNAPDYPVQNLYPCSQGPEPHVYWLLGGLLLTEGIIVQSDGYISYAPAMVARMKMTQFNVVSHIDAWDERCEYKLRLVYVSKAGEFFEQYSAPVRAAEMDKFVFQIPLEHVDRNGWFTCVLHISLLTPMPPGNDRDVAISEGREEPMMPVIVKGSYLEIRG